MKQLFITLLLISTCTLHTMAQDNYMLEFYFQSNSIEGDFATLTKIWLTDSADVIIPPSVSYQGFNFKVIGLSDKVYDEDEHPHYLRSITLPETLESIGNNAIIFCRNLHFIEIPKNVKEIGYSAFHSCRFLKEAIVHCSGVFSNAQLGIFSGCSSLMTIYYTNAIAPQNWVATTRTYVPDIEEYSSPFKNLTSTPHIIEMITFNENTFDYTGGVPLVTWKNNVEGYTATMDLSLLKVDAGTYIDTIPVTFTGEHPFVANIPYRYTIKPIKLTAKVNSCSRQYGEENPQFNISYSGFLSGDNESVITTKPSVTTIATRTSNIGDYPISISGGEAKNYEFVYKSGVLTVNKAPLTITINNASREYGDDNPTFTYDMEGLKNGEKEPTWNSRPQLITDAKKNSSVGQYEINVVNAESPNYEVTTNPGTLTITKAPLTVKVNDASKLYGEVNPDFSYSMQGQKFGETIEWSKEVQYNTLATKVSEVGEYKVTLSGTIENPNYDQVVESGKLTVLKRPLTLSTPNYTRYFGEENPDFELSYEGFVDGENFNNLTKRPIVTTTATKFSDVGTYQLSLSGGEAKNYELIDKCGTLTIEKANQSLIWNQEFTDVKKYAQIELNATATSGLDVTYTLIEGEDVANLYTLGNKTYLDVIASGSIVIMAQQEGTRNYYSSEKLYKTIEVQGKTVTLTMKDGEQGELRENVISGQSREITILPAKDYKIHSVTYNDMDVTDQLSSDGLFTTAPILEDATLYIVFESTSDAVPYVEDVNPTRISARRGEVVVTNLKAGEQIFVFDIEGREQASVTSNGYSTSIQLKTEQTYIVKAGNKTVKVRL